MESPIPLKVQNKCPIKINLALASFEETHQLTFLYDANLYHLIFPEKIATKSWVEFIRKRFYETGKEIRKEEATLIWEPQET